MEVSWGHVLVCGPLLEGRNLRIEHQQPENIGGVLVASLKQNPKKGTAPLKKTLELGRWAQFLGRDLTQEADVCRFNVDPGFTISACEQGGSPH